MSAERVPLGDVPTNHNASNVPGRTQVPFNARRAQRQCGPKPQEAQAPEKVFALAVSRAMGVVVVTGHGHLGASEADMLRAVLVDLIEGQGNLKVVLDASDVSGLDRSSLAVLAAAVDAAALLGGELTFADPSEAGTNALKAAGLGEAITQARECGQRALAEPPPGLGAEAARRAARSQHPAGTASHRENPWLLVAPNDEPTIYPGVTLSGATRQPRGGSQR